MDNRELLKKIMKISPKQLENISNGWVVHNLKLYGNSAIPKSLLKAFGNDGVEELLTRILEEPVVLVQDETSKEYTVWIERKL